MNLALFAGVQVCLAAIEPERDAVTLSRWTHDPELMRLLSTRPARPLAPAQIRKQLATASAGGVSPDQFHLMIRARSDDRPLGFARLFGLLWNHGVARLELAIADPADRGRGLGSEALGLVLRYAFDELNLHRLSANTCAYNRGAIHFLQRAGFSLEVTQRQAVERAGQRWDLLQLGLLRSEWETARRPRGETR